MIHDKSFAELTADELYAVLRLRSEVFVVEQECVYLDPDGRDTEAATRHMWIPTDSGEVATYLRVLDDRTERRIGRVVTAPDVRGGGLAERLMRHVLATTAGPWVLDAQSHLVGWYERLGFTATGPEFVEDGIPHTPMHRP